MSVALGLVAVFGGFLAWLGLAALFAPKRAQAFLLGFAATPVRHFLELGVRIAVGLALIVASPQLAGSVLFLTAGWVLLASTTVMALLPYRLHQAFAKRSVPAVLPYLTVIGLASLAAGLVMAWSVYAAMAG